MHRYFVTLLKEFNQSINHTIRDLVTDFTIEALLLLIGISFLYGLIHTAGPGHGKLLVTSFFTKEKHPLRKVFTLAGTISVVHSGFAVVLSLLIFYVFTGVRGMFKIKMQSYFIIASGILILTIGLLFLILKILKKDDLDFKFFGKSRNVFLVGLAAGIVPCPAALMIMLLTLSKDAVVLGLISVAAISIGMFLLLSLVGYLSLRSRQGILTIAEGKIRRVEKISVVIEYLSIILIIAIGTSMVVSICP